MTPTLRVAIHGFGDFERRALGSFFRLAVRPAMALEQVRDIAAAHVIVADADADADAPGVIEHLGALGRIADTVFVGAHAPVQAAARLARPIDALQVLREIDALAATRHAPPAPPGASTSPRTPPREPHGNDTLRPSSAGFVALDGRLSPRSRPRPNRGAQPA